MNGEGSPPLTAKALREAFQEAMEKQLKAERLYVSLDVAEELGYIVCRDCEVILGRGACPECVVAHVMGE